MPAIPCNIHIVGYEDLNDSVTCDIAAYCIHAEGGVPAALPAPLREAAEQAVRRGWFKAAAGETYVLHPAAGDPAAVVLLIGLGKSGPDNSELADSYRLAGSRLGRFAAERRAASAVVRLGEPGHPVDPEMCRVFAEGIGLGLYRRRVYRKAQEEREQREQFEQPFTLTLAGDHPDRDAASAAAGRGMVFAEATAYARDLTNVPGNLMHPRTLAEEAARLAEECGLVCTVLDEKEIEAQGMGGLAAVGRGSHNPPRLIALKYNGGGTGGEVLGLVGKGITFDTGGISLKRAQGMEEMVGDMGGAAVVLAVMRALARLQAPVNAVAVIPAAENMPSGKSYRPGDVITTLSGRTIEVVNTDAEGRIVLADAMTYACRQGATRIIDVATLTGAALVALGDVATAAVTNDEAFLERLMTAARQSGEKVWQLPAYPEYRKMIDSKVADLKNSAGRYAGTITGALFVGEFAEGLPWIHLDIAGTSWLSKARGVDPEGATGAMVRTLLHLSESL